MDDVLSRLVAGHGQQATAELRREFICQEGRVYARLRFGSGKKRNKENGGYIYKGHISKYADDIRWRGRIIEYAKKHINRCHYTHADLEFTRQEAPSGRSVGVIGIRPKRRIAGGVILVGVSPHNH